MGTRINGCSDIYVDTKNIQLYMRIYGHKTINIGTCIDGYKKNIDNAKGDPIIIGSGNSGNIFLSIKGMTSRIMFSCVQGNIL
jgi:hypothetical protein